jgi:hypothetical protein
MSRLTVLLVAAALVSAASASAQPAHLQLGWTLLNQIISEQSAGVFTDSHGVELNLYGGHWGSVTDPEYIQLANPASGILPENNTECAPLVTQLLLRSYNWSWMNRAFLDPITLTIKKVQSPYPYQYVALIKQLSSFSQQIKQFNQAIPGDIVSWWKPGSTSGGHTFQIVSVNWNSLHAYPTGYTNSIPALAGSHLYPVQVLDSSADLHTADTRELNVNGSLVHIPGIGSGYLGIVAGPNSQIIGCTWSLPNAYDQTHPTAWISFVNNNLKYAGSGYEIVIGRLPPQ